MGNMAVQQLTESNEMRKVIIILCTLGICMGLVSVDRGGLSKSREFLNELGVENMTLLYDKKGALARKMKTIGYPSTVLINKAGKQFGILIGPANWNSDSAHGLIDRLIADQ